MLPRLLYAASFALAVIGGILVAGEWDWGTTSLLAGTAVLGSATALCGIAAYHDRGFDTASAVIPAVAVLTLDAFGAFVAFFVYAWYQLRDFSIGF
ncbi:MAG TPA: hypothetical protein VFL61_08540 [Gaiellaceae bacterium]|nr:hypothetical protein [Gaiellaceae bacterium]